MNDVILVRHGEMFSASINTETQEVVFDDKTVTGKMWLVASGGDQFVEIVEEEGKYRMIPAF